MPQIKLPTLPCYPCPHRASCCAYGTTLSEDEAAAVRREHGEGFVYRTRWGEWRTRVRQGRCVFYRGGGCLIHQTSYYPAVCAGFPWTDAETGGPYQWDRTICGEFVRRPELLAIHPYVAPGRQRPVPVKEQPKSRSR